MTSSFQYCVAKVSSRPLDRRERFARISSAFEMRRSVSYRPHWARNRNSTWPAAVRRGEPLLQLRWGRWRAQRDEWGVESGLDPCRGATECSRNPLSFTTTAHTPSSLRSPSPAKLEKAHVAAALLKQARNARWRMKITTIGAVQ